MEKKDMILTRENVINRLRFGTIIQPADFSGCILAHMDLSDLDFRHAILDEASLFCSNLQHATLYAVHAHGADFRGANCERTSFRNSDLAGSSFYQANLYRADFDTASLRNCNLTSAVLGNVNFNDANLSGALGLLSPIDFIKKNFETTSEGVIAYKCFGAIYAPPERWKLEPGSVIAEEVNANRANTCGCGVNVGPYNYVARAYEFMTIWKVLIRWEWLPGVVVPYGSDGKIRCERVQLLEKVGSGL